MPLLLLFLLHFLLHLPAPEPSHSRQARPRLFQQFRRPSEHQQQPSSPHSDIRASSHPCRTEKDTGHGCCCTGTPLNQPTHTTQKRRGNRGYSSILWKRAILAQRLSSISIQAESARENLSGSLFLPLSSCPLSSDVKDEDAGAAVIPLLPSLSSSCQSLPKSEMLL